MYEGVYIRQVGGYTVDRQTGRQAGKKAGDAEPVQRGRWRAGRLGESVGRRSRCSRWGRACKWATIQALVFPPHSQQQHPEPSAAPSPASAALATCSGSAPAWQRTCWAAAGAKGRTRPARPPLRPQVDASIQRRRLVKEARLLQVAAGSQGRVRRIAQPKPSRIWQAAPGLAAWRRVGWHRSRWHCPAHGPGCSLPPNPTTNLRSSASSPGGRPRQPGLSRKASSSSLQAWEHRLGVLGVAKYTTKHTPHTASICKPGKVPSGSPGVAHAGQGHPGWLRLHLPQALCCLHRHGLALQIQRCSSAVPSAEGKQSGIGRARCWGCCWGALEPGRVVDGV